MQEKRTLLQLKIGLPLKVILTALGMLAMTLFVYRFQIPNPNMLLITALVVFSALFGFSGGVVAAVIMFAYSLFFFSTDHSFVHFTPENLQKVGVALVGILGDLFFVCSLKQSEMKAFIQVDGLTKKLQEENELLRSLSLTDGLTRLRNRLALTQDYDRFKGHDLIVMVLDLDDFKLVNDNCGHEEGDRVLQETARLLMETFGLEHCYRLGGDEFLAILPDMSEEEFLQKREFLAEHRPEVQMNGKPFAVNYSIGHALGEAGHIYELQALMAQADEKMYEVKRDRHKQALETPSGRRQSRPNRESIHSLPDTSATPSAMEGTGAQVEVFTAAEMQTVLTDLAGKYALARVVDPMEGRIIEFGEDGRISMDQKCYSIWNSGHKCVNCSSVAACKTGCRMEKEELFQDQVFFIESRPVTLKLPDGGLFDAVMELVSLEGNPQTANDREAENAGNRAAQYHALHDNLTRTLNASAFYEEAREAIREHPGRHWTMVTGNIRDFRLINTLFGVLKGNEALVKTAQYLLEIAGKTGGICARLGGDSFALLLPSEAYREEDFLEMARELAGYFSSGTYTFCIHFGVYKMEDASIPVSVMCDRANSALRTIREDLRRTMAYFDDAIMDRWLFEHEVISGFGDALQSGQFRMYLQPLVGEDGTVFGGEALVRWQRPDGSFVMPGDFINTLERSGLIHELDQYIWECAVKQLGVWKEEGKEDLCISVNMSAKDFYSLDVYQVLSQLVDRYQVDSSRLRLEITETALLEEREYSDAVIKRLREKGFMLEIDDFGKGYSSLALLKDIKVDVLKIDMCFLQEEDDRQRGDIILESVIGLARSLGMEVITEGVETQVQLDSLTQMGCRQFQGYYFSRPVPVADFERMAFGG